MKKAKEYADEIISSYVEHNEAYAVRQSVLVMKNLFEEVDTIRQKRNIPVGYQRYQSMLNILKEQNSKWIAISRKVNSQINLLNENAFLETVEETMPMVYENLMLVV